MKKSSQQFTASVRETSKNNIVNNFKYKTTNINVLLNRVRLEKKKNFTKKIFLTSLIISAISISAFIVLI